MILCSSIYGHMLEFYVLPYMHYTCLLCSSMSSGNLKKNAIGFSYEKTEFLSGDTFSNCAAVPSRDVLTKYGVEHLDKNFLIRE